MEALVQAGADLRARERWERTPFLMAVCMGDIERAQWLLEHGAEFETTGRFKQSVLQMAAEYGRLEMLNWLLEQGCDPNARDESGGTALMVACEANDLEIVRRLLEAGADIRPQRFGERAISQTSLPEIIALLVERGAEWGEVAEGVRASILGFDWEGELVCSRQDYERAKNLRFGRANPERADEPFWKAMARCGATAFQAREKFGASTEDEEPEGEKPVWCYRRFGKSFTPLPDGRIIEVGGEHEDFYDPDFCIYNDVFVHHGDGTFEIYLYPETVFPPTDFHSATLVGEWIYLIGCLGYDGTRRVGHTPVYRLNTSTFEIERVETSGDHPGWISEHRARVVAGEIHVWCGQLWDGPQQNDGAMRSENGPSFDEDEPFDETIAPELEIGEEDWEAEEVLDKMDELFPREEEEEDADPTVWALDLATMFWRRLPPAS